MAGGRVGTRSYPRVNMNDVARTHFYVGRPVV
jgi:hypothetical protein